MADLSPLLGEERMSDFGAVRSVDDPYETFNRVDQFAKRITLWLSTSGAETRGGGP
jgi:hypothetical protein